MKTGSQLALRNRFSTNTIQSQVKNESVNTDDVLSCLMRETIAFIKNNPDQKATILLSDDESFTDGYSITIMQNRTGKR